MKLSVANLVAAGIGPTQAKAFVDPLQVTLDQFEINTPMRQASFLGQCAHESGLFVHLEEGLFYRDAKRLTTLFRVFSSVLEAQTYLGRPEALANFVYAGRNGNGSEMSGDGWRYRGRGLFQLTGRNNYTSASLDLARPYLQQPELVAQPTDACLTAGWFWDRHHLNTLADAGSVDLITRAINGIAMAGAVERRALVRGFYKVLEKV